MRAERLVAATEADFDALMAWFPSAEAVNLWGGPRFRYPFTRESFMEDCHWPEMATRALRAADTLLGFGQFYERHGRINLARLVVNPGRRGEGLGSRLVAALLEDSKRHLDNTEYSLYVYRDNKPALNCYLSAGFNIVDYPDDDPLADSCYYLTRPVEGRR